MTKMSQPDDVAYRGCTIEVQSYKSDGERWRPKAVVSVYEGGKVHLKQVPAPLDVLFASEQEADVYTVAMAKQWIDDNVAPRGPKGK